MCIHCLVSGKVQGVWFRADTQNMAKEIGVTGFARNLPDGRVEVIACGEQDKIQLFFSGLQKGTQLATVSDVTYEEIAWQDHSRFAVK
jgi:acylphosphatase